MTVGDDQRIKTWLLDIDKGKRGVEGFEVAKGRDVASAVADVATVDVVGDEEEGKGMVVVVGIGMEVWSLGNVS